MKGILRFIFVCILTVAFISCTAWFSINGQVEMQEQTPSFLDTYHGPMI